MVHNWHTTRNEDADIIHIIIIHRFTMRRSSGWCCGLISEKKNASSPSWTSLRRTFRWSTFSSAGYANIFLNAFFSLSLFSFLRFWTRVSSAAMALSSLASVLASTRTISASSSSLMAMWARPLRYKAFAAKYEKKAPSQKRRRMLGIFERRTSVGLA